MAVFQDANRLHLVHLAKAVDGPLGRVNRHVLAVPISPTILWRFA